MTGKERAFLVDLVFIITNLRQQLEWFDTHRNADMSHVIDALNIQETEMRDQLRLILQEEDNQDACTPDA